MHSSPPRVIADKYRLLGLLGRGGMGSVWRAEHMSLNSPVAIKLLEPWIASEPLGIARFMREARAAAMLRSPHVVQIFDHGVDQGNPYIVMEMLQGESLAARLEREGRLSLSETVRIVTHVARALSRAHAAGIVHRDLKPENVFLVEDEDEPVAKLLDFGIAKGSPSGFEGVSEHTTGPGILVGTPYYASPEQAQGAKLLDHRSDVWALGVIAYECLLGERPFEGESLAEILVGICAATPPVPSARGVVPAGFDAWFARACSRDIEQRFESARLAASELAMLCSMPQTELPTPVSSPLRARDDDPSLSTTASDPPKRRSHRTLVAGGVATSALFAVLAFAFFRARTPELPAGPVTLSSSLSAAMADSRVASAPPSEPASGSVEVVPVDASQPGAVPASASEPAPPAAASAPLPQQRAAALPRRAAPPPPPRLAPRAARMPGAPPSPPPTNPQPPARVSVDLGI